jgi:hypothetical protein
VVYLADFRPADNTKDYISTKWEYVSLISLGLVDSLSFSIASSDVGAFGINTPTYFCIDQVSTANGTTPVIESASEQAKIYPNPANDFINIDHKTELNHISAIDLSGKSIIMDAVGNNIYSTSEMIPGLYLIKDKNAIIGKISIIH